MVEIRITEFDLYIVDVWNEEASFVQGEVCLEVDIEIFEVKLDLAVTFKNWVDDSLHCTNFPTFDGREVNFDELLSKLLLKVNFDVLNIKSWLSVVNIFPKGLPFKSLDSKEVISVIQSFWEWNSISADVIWQKSVHRTLHCFYRLLLKSNLHSWIHARYVLSLDIHLVLATEES